MKSPKPYPAPVVSSLITSITRHETQVKLNPEPRSIKRASCKSINSYFHSRARIGVIRGGSNCVMGWNVNGARKSNPGIAKDRVNWGFRNLGKSEIKPAPDGPQPGRSSTSVDDQSLSYPDVHEEGSKFT